MPADAGLTLRLFGAPRLAGPGVERAAGLLTKPKALALLAYIAIARPRGLRRRDEILALLWPDSSADRARNALRQSLFLLRTHLPDRALISRGNTEVGLATGDLDVDVWRFEDLLGGGREREALALYEGPLLDGFSLYANSDFDAWLAMVLAGRSRADGDDTASAEWARFALDRSPYDEELLREVMELFRERGDPAGAEHLYRDAVTRFRVDLGIPLSPETERAGRALSRQSVASTSGALTSGALTSGALTSAGGSPPRPAAAPPATSTALRRPRVVAPDARRLYLEARQLAAQKSPVTITKAIDCYERAIELSPEYAEAQSGLGFALCQAVVYVAYPGTSAWPRAKAHASRAIRLDPLLGEGHAVLAHVTLCYDYDWARAEALYRKALELDPINTVSRQLYALYYLTSLGRTDDALAVLDRARDEFPDNPGISVYYAMISVMGRRFERGLREVDFVLDGHPGLVQAHWVRGMALEGLGRFAAAIEAFEVGVAMTNRSSLLLSQLGRACANGGDHARATRILAELDARGEDGGPGAYFGGEILAALGSTELALDRLHAAYRQRNPFMVFVGVMYGLDPLRDTRRFRDLLMRIGLRAHAPARPSSTRSAMSLDGVGW
jgi:DNA-binding SARP family transcriptional activator